jgi:hypothetical protein
MNAAPRRVLTTEIRRRAHRTTRCRHTAQEEVDAPNVVSSTGITVARSLGRRGSSAMCRLGPRPQTNPSRAPPNRSRFGKTAGRSASITLWGRVEKKRGGVQNRRRLMRAASFVAALAERSIAPSLRPAHRTGRADFPHPALGRVSRQGMRAAGRARRGQDSGDRTPRVPNTACMGNCR